MERIDDLRPPDEEAREPPGHTGLEPMEMNYIRAKPPHERGQGYDRRNIRRRKGAADKGHRPDPGHMGHKLLREWGIGRARNMDLEAAAIEV